MNTKHVVTSFLEKDGQILILKRSARVGTYQGRWGGVAGYIEPGIAPLQQAFQEIREEVGLAADDVEFLKEGETLEVLDEGLSRVWIVHPFRFRVRHPEKIQTDWEHVETAWIDPQALASYDTVPRLLDAWARVAGRGPGARGQGPEVGGQGPETKGQRPETRDQGPGTSGQEPGTRDQEA